MARVDSRIDDGNDGTFAFIAVVLPCFFCIDHVFTMQHVWRRAFFDFRTRILMCDMYGLDAA